MDKETLHKFILDPDWRKMEAYILGFFESETDVAAINTEMESSAVHAEVIARVRIKQAIEDMKASFESARDLHTQEQVSFK